MITQPAEMMMARRQWYAHFRAQLGSGHIQHPGGEIEAHWMAMGYCRRRYIELRQSWARERTAAALAAAEAEIARLRAENGLLRDAVINAKFDVRYVKNCGRNMKWETCERNLNATYDMLCRIIERTNPALEPQEVTDGNG